MAGTKQYYTEENMRGKKLSDFASDVDFIEDSVTFLKSNRKGYTDEDFSSMNGEDVVDEVLEHFRWANTNEVSMAKDFSYIKDDKVPEEHKQAYGRLLFAFDNAEGEGMWDDNGKAVRDYLAGAASAPSTVGSVVAGMFTGGTGAAAIQGSKAAAQVAVRAAAKKYLKRAVLGGMLDGSVAAGSQLGLEAIKADAGDTIEEEYDINYKNVAAAGAIGGTLGFGVNVGAAALQKSGANKLIDTLDTGRQAQADRIADAAEKANIKLKAIANSQEKKDLADEVIGKMLFAIDPKLVDEGMKAKVDILSADLPDGLIAGLDRRKIQILGAAAFDLAEELKIKPGKGIRITEQLANIMETPGGSGTAREIFDRVRKEYGLSARELSAVYAAEVSEAAKILVGQKNLKNNLGGTVTPVDANKFKEKLDALYKQGMSRLSSEDAKVLIEAQEQGGGIAGKTWRTFRSAEDLRRALMTSQPTTTMRNNIFGVAMGAIDMVDQVGINLVRKARGKTDTYEGLQGAADVMSYLTRDAYVADAVTTMLSDVAPEKMSKVFYQAAQAEAGTTAETGAAKVGAFFNKLNTVSDHIFKKAVVVGSIDRSLKRLNDPKLGTSVMDMLEKGTIAELPEDILQDALDESLEFTFQKRFGGKGSSAESKKVKALVDGITRNGFTVLIPFPRYLASQAKHISDYTGLTILRRLATGSDIADKEIAKAMTGAAVGLVHLKVQQENIANGRDWFEWEDDRTRKDAQAALGPQAYNSFIMHQVARAMEGLPNKLPNVPFSKWDGDTGAFIKDSLKLLAGSEFRPNSGLVTKVSKGLDTGSWKPVGEEIGDYFSAFTYPAAAVKDFYGQFDPLSTYFPETRDGLMSYTNLSEHDVDSPITMQLGLFRRITRQLPDFPAANNGEKGMLEFFRSSTAVNYQSKYNQEADRAGLGYDALRFDVFGDGPIRALDPLLKQLTGFASKPIKNDLQREITRLQLDPFTLYNPYREKNTAVTLMTEQILQGNLAFVISEQVLKDPDYQRMSIDEQKRLLKGMISAKVTIAKEMAVEELDAMYAMEGDSAVLFMGYQRGRVEKLDKNGKANADLAWPLMAERFGYSRTATLDEVIEEIRTTDKYDDDPQELMVKETDMIMNYLHAGGLYGERYREVIRDLN